MTRTALLALLALATACATGSTGSSLDFGMASATSRTAGAPVLTAESSGSAVTVTEAIAVLRDIELDLPDGLRCADLGADELVAPVRCSEDKIHVDGPFELDLIARTSTPSLADLTLPAGTYRRVDLRFDADTDDDDVSLRIAGTLDIRGEPVGLELALDVNEDARFESPGGIVVDDASGLLGLLDADVLFGALTIADCLDDGDLAVEEGVVRIGPDSRCDIADAVEEVLKESWDLDRDDHDETEHESENHG